MIVSADRVFAAEGLLAPGWVHVEGALVVDVGSGAPPRPADHELSGATVVPGFVDAHVHGGGGASFDAGTPEQAATVARAHLAHGTTSLNASLVTDTPQRLATRLRELGALVDDGLLAGLHLEGPWLSPLHAGAHDPALLTAPTPQAVDDLVRAGDGRLRMVTLAPELPGALDAVRRLVDAGVTVALGHTDATYDVTCAALEAGATVGTHLFNAMRGLHHREPGPVPALLEHPAAFVELIADGVHLHPAVLGLAARVAPRRTVLVSDAMAAAAAGGDGDYRLGPVDVAVRDGVARLAGSGAIAGSTLTLAAAVRYAAEVAGVPLVDAVHAASAAPAAALGLDTVGTLRPGHRADLVVLDERLDVARVMHRGGWVDRP